jgi:hypothetical protein
MYGIDGALIVAGRGKKKKDTHLIDGKLNQNTKTTMRHRTPPTKASSVKSKEPWEEDPQPNSTQ